MARGYGAYVSMNGIRDAVRSFKGQVKAMDVIIGAIAGKVIGKALGTVLVTQITKASPTTGATIAPYSDVVGGLATGFGLYLAQKGSARAKGHFVGAVAAPLIDLASQKAIALAVSSKIPGFSALVSYDAYRMGLLTNDAAYGRSMGLLTNDSAYGRMGLLTNDSAYGNMNDLRAYSEHSALPEVAHEYDAA